VILVGHESIFSHQRKATQNLLGALKAAAEAVDGGEAADSLVKDSGVRAAEEEKLQREEKSAEGRRHTLQNNVFPGSRMKHLVKQRIPPVSLEEYVVSKGLFIQLVDSQE
jgi:hypothetical protein